VGGTLFNICREDSRSRLKKGVCRNVGVGVGVGVRVGIGIGIILDGGGS